jgi:hypothetical protein
VTRPGSVRYEGWPAGAPTGSVRPAGARCGGRPVDAPAVLAPRHARRASGLLLALLLLLGLLSPLVLAACGNADPFVGLYWEPASGRRMEIRHTQDGYELYYGRDLRPFPATRDGDVLTITDPMGGKTTLRPGQAEGTLQMVSGGKTTVLKPLPQHQ